MENMVEIRNLSKQFQGFSLKDVSFKIKKGFITGFIGPNGAGKSTTIRCLMNLINIDSGDIKIFQTSHAENTVDIKQRIGFVYDENYFYDDLSIEKNKRVIAPFYKNWNDSVFYRYLEEFQLPTNRQVKHLSKGMKMKFSLALALSHDPELIIMDEPTSGLDPIVRRELLDMLLDIIQDEEKAVFFSTHNTTDLEKVADYITFIHDGNIVFSEEKDDIFEKYALVKGNRNQAVLLLDFPVIGRKDSEVNFECLIDRKHLPSQWEKTLIIEKPTLEEIMYYTVKGVNKSEITSA